MKKGKSHLFSLYFAHIKITTNRCYINDLRVESTPYRDSVSLNNKKKHIYQANIYLTIVLLSMCTYIHVWVYKEKETFTHQGLRDWCVCACDQQLREIMGHDWTQQLEQGALLFSTAPMAPVLHCR